MKQLISGCVADKDGHLKRGDCIISVNGQSLSGFSKRDALQILKEAGDHVTLEISRKIGRKLSTAATPLSSTLHSQQGSGESSHIQSRKMSPQRSPRATYRRARATTGSSDEGSREGSRASSPQPTKKHHRRGSVTAQGEVLTFRDNKSTLPRKIRGAKKGVHLIELHKGPTGLGLQLQGSMDGSTPITVKAVLRGGPAFKSGKMRVGDEIIEVNGISFEKMNHSDAVKTMKGLPQGKVSIILREQ